MYFPQEILVTIEHPTLFRPRKSQSYHKFIDHIFLKTQWFHDRDLHPLGEIQNYLTHTNHTHQLTRLSDLYRTQ